MKTVYQPNNLAEAYMLRDLLQQEGIESYINGEYLQGAIGELPVNGLLRLEVMPQDEAKAMVFISNWEKSQPAEATILSKVEAKSSVYLKCFVCAVIGFLLGAVSLYMYFRVPIYQNGMDRNKDGVLDEMQFYSQAGLLKKLEIDRNFDGKIDTITDYDEQAMPSSFEADDNFDGVFETHGSFFQGNLIWSKSDFDGDGYKEQYAVYKHGVLDYIEFSNYQTGKVLRREHFKANKLLFADVDKNQDGVLDTRLFYDDLGEVKERLSLR